MDQIEKRIRSLILFCFGLAFLVKFAFYTPELLNPYITFLIGCCIFGPAVAKLWRGPDEKDD